VCWHGDQRALAIDKKMAEFVSTVNASSMSGPVLRSSGSLGNDHNSTFVTSLMTALISDSKYQAKLDEYWKEAVALGDENYFNQSLKLLNGLLVSGNMPNLMNANSGMTGIAKSKVANAPAVSLQGRTLQVRTDGVARVDVFNVAGHAVKTQAGSQAMDLQGIPAGVYMVRIQAKNATVMQKIRLQ
jgi:hypothetical protein